MPHTYETDGAAIYRQSFAMIRAESDLARFDEDEEQVAVRMIHAAGMVDLAADIHFSSGFVPAARDALQVGGAILCDARMVSEGVTRPRLPADNPVICTLHDPAVADLARQMGTTRSAAATCLHQHRIIINGIGHIRRNNQVLIAMGCNLVGDARLEQSHKGHISRIG